MTINAVLQGFTICTSFYGARFQVPSDPKELQLMASLWCDALSDVPDELAVAAFRRFGATSKVPPRPVDIRALAQPGGLPTAAEAWAEAWDTACTRGYNEGRVPQMSRPEIEAAAVAANWHAVCFADNDRDLAFTRQAFMRAYEDFCTRTNREESRAAIEGSVPPGLLPHMKGIEGGRDE